MGEFTPEFQNYVAGLLGPRYVWALHTEPVRILMRVIMREQNPTMVIESDAPPRERSPASAGRNPSAHSR